MNITKKLIAIILLLAILWGNSNTLITYGKEIVQEQLRRKRRANRIKKRKLCSR